MREIKSFCIYLTLGACIVLTACSGSRKNKIVDSREIIAEEDVNSKEIALPDSVLSEETTAIDTLVEPIAGLDTQIDFTPTFESIIDSLAKLKLMYSTIGSEKRDCSGVFFRFLESVQAIFPNIEIPEIHRYRSTRDLARWFAEKDTLQIVHEPFIEAKNIKPGVVMFYGGQGKKLSQITLQGLFRSINHMGVVYSVERNKDDVVQSYRLFHGRSPGKVASITNWHGRKPSRASYPPLGNGTEQWIGYIDLNDFFNRKNLE